MKNIIFLLLVTNVVFTKGYSQAPTFAWAKANFGDVNDNVEEVAIDTQGNVIEVGFFKSSTDFSTGLGTFNLQGNALEQSPYPSSCTNCPYGDTYIAKYNTSGSLMWYLRSNGEYSETISSVTTDNEDNIYVCGTYLSLNFSLGDYSTTDTIQGLKGFIAKISPSGSVMWLQKIIPTLGNYPASVVVGSQFINLKTDSQGNVYASGQMRASSINAGTLSLNLVVANNQYRQDCFIVKYDTNGNPIWLKGIQGIDTENITKIGVDNLGYIYFSGTTYSPNLIVSANTYTTGNDTSGTMNSSFTGKIDTYGNAVWLDFSDYGDIWLFDINETTTDSQGNVYTVGSTSGAGLDFFAPHSITFGPSSITIPYVPDVRRDRVLVVCKYSPTGEKLWMKTSPANLYISGNGIEVDDNGIIYILGQYIVPTNFGGFTLPNSNFVSVSISSSNPEYKTFVAALNTNSDINWARQTGNHFKLETADFEVDNNGSIVIGGKFIQGNSINFDGFILSGYPNGSGFRDAYIAKFNQANLSNENFENNNLVLSPNPTQNILNIQSQGAIKEIFAYDILGQEVHLITISNNILDTSNLTKGVYLIKIIGENDKILTSRFIKD
ncbi:MAG: T9SS type A sorting domain-containing protein [Flavobacteriales bacterium]|nr:T9SS type A sorting domain-containing protein [Flavobacteriales bacterium]